MEKIKLISLQGLSQFWDKVKAYIDGKFSVVNKKVDARIWKGKQEDIDAAIQNGEIIPGYTQLIITDDDEEEIIYQWCTEEDILHLFGLA